jgi:hypothetical protein
VAGSPQRYRAYLRSSRGEFSCAKPSCSYFQNAWISDRTVCYLACGKPAVVADTGASSYLPDGEGLFRFRTTEQAVEALAAANRDYRRHCRAARDLAETYFDAVPIITAILDVGLAPPATPTGVASSPTGSAARPPRAGPEPRGGAGPDEAPRGGG